jgi:endoglucanase
LSRSLDGQPTSQDQTPLGDVAAAAAANGAGATTTRNQLLAAADAVARRYPTYYGTAWAALGRVLLTTHLLSGCD